MLDKRLSKYERITSQICSLFVKCTDPVARMATISAILHHKMGQCYWTGFYLYHDGKLTVGPYQGTLACLELKKDTGVCWAAVNSREPVVVPDVHSFEGHIACDPKSRAEITVPVFQGSRVKAVLDIDSTRENAFDLVDAEQLNIICSLIYREE